MMYTYIIQSWHFMEEEWENILELCGRMGWAFDIYNDAPSDYLVVNVPCNDAPLFDWLYNKLVPEK